MAAYDYRCRACGSVFEVHRPMTAGAAGVRCPGGHEDVTRVWSAVSLAGAAAAPLPAPGLARSVGPAAGGCCGGGCCG